MLKDGHKGELSAAGRQWYFDYNFKEQTIYWTNNKDDQVVMWIKRQISEFTVEGIYEH